MLLTLHLLASLLLSTIQPLDVKVTTTAAAKGDFYLAVYANADAYRAQRPTIGAVKPAADGVSFTVTLPASGDYVISGYHDVNGNGELDFNMLGIPKEPYGFVTPPDSKFKEPGFEEIATSIRGGEKLVMNMKLWKEF